MSLLRDINPSVHTEHAQYTNINAAIYDTEVRSKNVDQEPLEVGVARRTYLKKLRHRRGGRAGSCAHYDDSGPCDQPIDHSMHVWQGKLCAQHQRLEHSRVVALALRR